MITGGDSEGFKNGVNFLNVAYAHERMQFGVSIGEVALRILGGAGYTFGLFTPDLFGLG